MDYILTKEEMGYFEYPIAEKCMIKNTLYERKNKKIYRENEVIPSYEWMDGEKQSILYLPDEGITFERGESLFIGQIQSDIQIEDCIAKIYIHGLNLSVSSADKMALYLNQQRISNGDYEMQNGSVLLIGSVKLQIWKDVVGIWGKHYETELLQIKSESQRLPEHFPLYKRSPRLIKRIEEKTIKIDVDTTDKQGGKKNLLQTILPPIAMVLVTVVVSLVLKRGAFVLMSVAATGMSTIFSVVKFLQDKKEDKLDAQKKKEVYDRYLLDKQKEIYKQWKAEQDTYAYNYPSIQTIEQMVLNYSSRIYERSNMDADFLTLSIGHYIDTPTFKIEDKTNELSLHENTYAQMVKDIKAQFGKIDIPQIIDLKNANFGIVGEKSMIHEQMKLYFSQLSVMQSYHDVQFVVLFNEADQEEFQWLKWLPHSRLQGLNVFGLMDSEKIRDQVLGSVQQIIKERKQRLEEEKKSSRFTPHYVFWIDEPKLIMDHSIMEYLNGDLWEDLGFSIIYTSHLRANLPENIGTVLLLENSEEGTLLLNEKELCDRRLRLYHTDGVDFDTMARNLGVLEHVQGVASHIPEQVSFFQMYGIQKPEELNVESRWVANNSSKTLAVPLGARAEGDYLELNLHEKAHGPHGLVAGTTGSGKSEIVQSYILSLAVNFHPHEVGFLLIDYKGGGMANLFRKLPHLLGTITNLDGSESMRALASIQAELKRREAVFGQYGVNHINGYTDLVKQGVAKEPIPHLFIISDEFAELKKEQPEFMKELVSTARVGRSLGVHLILATQKPTGIVDDQIWSNSKFKLCLKVQNEADSKEVLHTPDAANITQAGRAYLQVGNNEIYELFQSAWSGALYIEESEKEVTQDNRIYLVNALGQGELINKDLRGSLQEQKSTKTQLDAVVEYIANVYERMECRDVARPWLPSLSDCIVNPNMNIRTKDKLDLSIDIGMCDIPEQQLQTQYCIDLQRQGNVLYIASSGYGKTMFLTNVILNLAVKNSVSNLHFYVLDFGNNALISLSRLPHMAAYIMLDDEEKFAKFQTLMVAEIKDRKKKMADAMAQNFYVYNETAKHPLQAIVICIDNYDAIKEMGYEMEQYFTKLTREGSSIGIYVVVTASQMNAVRMATMNNFKNKIAGFNYDESEIKSLVGRGEYSLADIRGRAMVKMGEQVSVLQLYAPISFENEVDYGNRLLEFVKEIKEVLPEEEAPHIPILPEELSEQQFLTYPSEPNVIGLGLTKTEVLSVGMRKQNSPFLVLGDNGSGKTNVLKLILNQIIGNGDIYLVDSRSRKLNTYQKDTNYIVNLDQLEDFANDLQNEVRMRERQLDVSAQDGKSYEEIMEQFAPFYVVIDDIDDFCELAGSDLSIIATRIKKSVNYGITYIVTANVNKFKGQDEFTKLLKGVSNGILLSPQGYLTIFPVKAMASIQKPDACLMLDGKGVDIRVPRVE